MQAAAAGSLRSLLARPLIDQLANSTTAKVGTMTATAGSRFFEALIKAIGEFLHCGEIASAEDCDSACFSGGWVR